MSPTLSAATEERLALLFAPADRSQARRLLLEECGSNLPLLGDRDAAGMERFRFAALKLSEGNLGRLREAIAVAKTDWRDLLVAAGFANDTRAHETWRPAPLQDLSRLLGAMQPFLHDGAYVFASVPDGAGLAGLEPVATVREAEGLTVVVEERVALAAGLQPVFRAAWITLEVQSELQAVGLTAAFASALAREGIGCNVVAGAFHDHLFVPFDRRDDAMAVLRELQRRAGPPHVAAGS